MDDKERIEFIIKDKGLTNVEFSSITGIAPATISHITSGRSKPTLPVLKGILSGFPDLNPEWVFLGKGSIYKNKVDDETAVSEQNSSNGSMDLFSSLSTGESPSISEANKHQRSNGIGMRNFNVNDIKDVIRDSMTAVMGQQHRKIVEVRIFFDDGTYEAFNTPKVK